ncbi:MAG TPA: hypothetical protein VFY71_09345 [Planctomycetota bacterium]|nr:hypothetical protein [Planctomycetota bacterium]
MSERSFIPTEPERLACAVDRLTAAGYTHELRAEAGGLRDVATGRLVAPEQLVVDETVRIEGFSDPGDESIVLALHDVEGTLRGTFATSFGADVAEAEAEVLRRLPARHARGKGARRP